MKLNNYIKVNSERMSSMSESQDIAQILSGGQNVSKSRAYSLREAIEIAAESFDDETAQEYPELYPQWEADIYYEENTRICYNGELYTVPQAHTSQEQYPPGEGTEALYSKVLTSTDGTPLEWVQPDSTNGYQKGDRVIYNGVIYESIYDGLNVWSPDAYPAGWQVVE